MYQRNRDDEDPNPFKNWWAKRSPGSTSNAFYVCSGVTNSCRSNSDPFDALEWRKPIVGNVMKALADPDTHLLGVYGSDGDIKNTLLERVHRRIRKDNLFDLVLRARVTRKPDISKIQDELALQLGLILNGKSTDERANELIHRIKNQHKILIVLRDLYEGLDLGKVGIPYGSDDAGSKILLTSMDEDVLSKHMHTQKNFLV